MKESVLKSISIYTLSSIFLSGISFFLMPIFIKYLSTEEYGLLSLYLILINVLTPFITLQQSTSFTIYFYRYEKNILSPYISSIFINVFISLFIVYVLLYFFEVEIINVFRVNNKWYYFTPLIVLFSFFPQFLLIFFQLSNQPLKYSLFNITQVLLSLSLSLFFLMILKLGYSGRLLAILLVNVIFTSYCIYFLKKKMKILFFTFEKKIQMDSIKLSLPIVGHSLAGFVVTFSDRLFISKMIDVQSVGIYSVAYTIGSILLLFGDGLSTAAVPFLFESLKNKSFAKVKKFTLYSSIALIVLFILIALLMPFIYFYFINERYSTGQSYVFWILLGHLFTGFYKVIVVHYYFHQKTKYLAYIGIVKIVVTLVANFYLIKLFGVIGAAYATTITLFVEFLLTALGLLKFYSLKSIKV